MTGRELLARLRVIRAQLDEIGAQLRDVGSKADARVLADLRDCATLLEVEVRKGAKT
jgi:hypothetical protein